MLNYFFKKIKKDRSKNNVSFNLPGFSIIEVITVLLVISIGMAGTISLVTQSIRGQAINKNTLIAYQLAQEGIELIRFVRDTNWNQGEPWNTDLAEGDYYMDYTMDIPVSIPTGLSGPGVGKLTLNPSLGFYESEPSTFLPEGSFARIINISQPEPAVPKILVSVTVYWFDRGAPYSYSLETELYDWL